MIWFLKVNNNDSVAIQDWFYGKSKISVQLFDFIKFVDSTVCTKVNLNNFITNQTSLPVITSAASLARSTNLLIDAMVVIDVQPAMFRYENNNQMDNSIVMLSVNTTNYVSR